MVFVIDTIDPQAVLGTCAGAASEKPPKFNLVVVLAMAAVKVSDYVSLSGANDRLLVANRVPFVMLER